MSGFYYGQTEYNILSNCLRLEDYIKSATIAKYSFLTITDKNLYGAYKFYNLCKKASIKPIIGLEVNILDNENYPNTFLLYAKNNAGYKALLKLSTLLNCENKDLTIEDIKDNSHDLIVVLVGFNSIVERMLSSNNKAEALDFLKYYNNCFSKFYIGISLCNMRYFDINTQLYDLCKSSGVKCLPIHKTLYLNSDDYVLCNLLRQLGENKELISEYDDYSFPINIENEFSSYKEIILEGNSLSEEINIRLYEEKIELPSFPNGKGVDSFVYLKALCYKGLRKRLKDSMSQYNKYIARLNYELDIINRMGYNDYFLIVWDFILYAKQNNIYVGPGRGSAAGSLVAYCLGIIDIDPLKFDLLFERFLNPERISMPDIDTDFPDDRRDEVIEHVKNLYGKDHVCNISAFGTFQIKSAIRDLGRIMKISSERLDEIIILAEKKTDFNSLLADFEDRKELYDLLYYAKKIEGLPRHISTHAAGIILSNRKLDEIIPLQEGINGLYQSQFEAYDLEKIGLLKMDFLGIRNLTIINNIIKDSNCLSQDMLRHIPLDDKKVYSLLQSADTLGIFQLESTGIRNVLYNLKPNCFDDIVAVLALYRPGPMDNIREYIDRKNGKPYKFIHPSLEGILKNTYGIIVYQEQIMKIAQTFAGYSLGQADLLRRAVSKKDEKTLDNERNNFVASSINNGYDEKTANTIYDYIVKFANYGFNKSHSVAYAFLSYQMCYLKVNYFPLFMANVLNNSIGSAKNIKAYISYTKEHGLTTNCPNINISTNRFVSTKYGLFMPLECVLGIGEKIALDIIKEREKGLFLSFIDFKNRCSFLSSNLLYALIFAGAFNCFDISKRTLAGMINVEDGIIDRYLDDKIIDDSEYDFDLLRENEKKYLGFNISYSPFINIKKLRTKYNAIPINRGNLNSYEKFIGMFSDLKSFQTKKGEQMAKGNLSDDFSSIEVVIFPRVYSQIGYNINEKNLFLVEGKISINDRQKTILIINNVLNVEMNKK